MSQPCERRPVPTERRATKSSAAAKPLELFSAEDTRTRPQIACEWDRHRIAERRDSAISRRRRARDIGEVVWFEVGPKNTTAVTGERVIASIKKLQIPHHWHPYRQGVICLPSDHAADLIAYLEHRCRRRIEVVDVDRI